MNTIQKHNRRHFLKTAGALAAAPALGSMLSACGGAGTALSTEEQLALTA